MKMVVQTKRKNPSEEDLTATTNSKKRKQDISWLTEGIAGTDPFDVLKRFISEVEAFNANRSEETEEDSPNDIVLHFFQNGCTGKEILSLLETEVKRKATEVALIFSTLESLFVRVASDLTEYRNAGMQVAKSILQSHMKNVYLSLSPSSNANQIKTTLRLLTSMVTLGHLTAREVISTFDFSHACVTYILQRRSLTDLPDVRSTYLIFITSFIIEEDSMVLRILGENRDILQPIFNGLIYDSIGTLQLFLPTLRDKLVMSSLLSKTLKIRIFNEYTCQQLAQLFFWQGPHKAPKKNLKEDKDGKKAPIVDEDIEEDQNAVAETVTSLMMALCTSHKFGLAFADYSIGLSGKNKNIAVYRLIMALQEFWEQSTPKVFELLSNLIVKTLQSCPDLMRWYLREVTEDFSEIRSSGAWLSLSDMIKRILENQNLELVFNPREKFSAKQQAHRAATLITPPVFNRDFFVNALAFDGMDIQLSACHLLLSVLKKAEEFQHILINHPKAEIYSETEKTTISSLFSDAVVRCVPSSKILIERCTKLSSLKEEKDCVKLWTVLLDTLILYAQLGLNRSQEDEEKVPVGQLLNDVMDYVKESSDEQHVLEQLQLAVFKLVSLSTDDLNAVMTSEKQAEALESHVNCSLKATNLELSQCSRTFLLKMFTQCGVTRMSPVELNVWLLALKVHPDATGFFIETCKQLLTSPAQYEDQLVSMFQSNPPCSSLIVTAWASFTTGQKDVATYIRAVTSGLLLSQFENHQMVASALLASTPKQLSNESLRSLLQMWTQEELTIDTSAIGSNRLTAILLNCVCVEDITWDTTKDDWKAELALSRERLDELELTLYQALSCLTAADGRKANQMRVFELMTTMFEEEASRDQLTRKLLEHPYSLSSFDPINVKGSEFTVQFTAFIRDCLQRTKLDVYRKKLIESITSGITTNEKKKKKGGKKAAKKVAAPDQQLLLSLLQLFTFETGDIEQLISAIVELKPSTAAEPWLPLLNFLLLQAAHLRLTGVDHRIQWPIFKKVLELNLQFQSPEALKKGIADVISVCPEFLDSSEAVQDYRSLLESCLQSDCDGSQLCRLLIKDCQLLRSSFNEWCNHNENHLKSINWRLQIFADENTLNESNRVAYDRLHSGLSPEMIGDILICKDRYAEISATMADFSKFISNLILLCWQPEQCRALALKLLAQHKSGLSSYQFSDIGRKGSHCELHLTLCLRSAVWLFKNSDVPDVDEVEKLAMEMEWLCGQSDKELLVKTVMEDATWSKFIKYTLRIGLRAQSGDEAALPVATLRLLIHVWKLLASTVSDELLARAQQVYEMISSHSEFMTVILDEDLEYSQQKKLLLELLTVLVQIQPKLCQSGHVPLLLSSYQASRSCNDQLILRLLHIYEKNGVQLSTFKPYLWGAAAAAHYSIQRGAPTRLTSQPETGEIISLLDSDKLLATAYSFPVELNLDSIEMSEKEECYDPRFIVPLLSHILSSEYVVQCGKFTQSGAASVLFAALSSECGQMRALSWLALSRFNDQLLSATMWPERCLWLHLIESLRLGAAEQPHQRHSDRNYPQKLPNIITLFMAKAAAVLRDPTHPMYRPINNFILVKSALDVSQVPELFVFLHSSELPLQRTQQRTFLLQLLRDGLRNRLDYLVCARRRVFRLLLSMQPSELLADSSTKSLVLEVIQSALRNPIIAYDLIFNRGLVMWLNGLIMSPSSAAEAHQLLQVVETLWNTLHAHLLRKRNAQEKSEVEAVAELEREVLESEEQAPQSEEKKKPANVNPNGRKPIWDLLPVDQQVLAPSLMCELMQLLLSLWRALVHSEIDTISFETYTRILCAASQHLHESKWRIQKAQVENGLIFVVPSCILSTAFIKQLVDISPRFLSHLPDLKEHFDAVASLSSPKPNSNDLSSPSSLTEVWIKLYERMSKLENSNADDLSTRRSLHMLLSLAECGV